MKETYAKKTSADQALHDQIRDNTERLVQINKVFDARIQELHAYYQKDMEVNMAAYKASVAKEYQERFQKLKESVKDGKLVTMEDPQEIEKREKERQ